MAFKSVLRPGEPYHRELNEFPYQAQENGSCEQLGTDGRCKVYDHRPDLCNLQVIHDRYFSDQSRSFYQTTMNSCNKLIVEARLDPKFLVTEKSLNP